VITSGPAYGSQVTINLDYDALGGVLTSKANYGTSQRNEEYRRDSFGNAMWEGTTGETGLPLPKASTYGSSGRQTIRLATLPTNFSNCNQSYPDTLKQTYNEYGMLTSRINSTWTGGYGGCTKVHTTLHREWHWYAQDKVLRYVQREAGNPGHTVTSGTWEEYQYDALGRRIRIRERRDSLANSGDKESALTQVVWDGNQILYEMRGESPNDPVGPSYRYGAIGYTHGREIDAPLILSDGRIPVPDWRGMYQATVFANGAPADCSVGQANPCMAIELPGGNVAATYRPWAAAQESGVLYTWRGSLLLNGRDGTGMLYRRNRYYDPTTGRFTQVDPIGVAGGANLYGFADGDQVNFSDPFGFGPCTNSVAALIILCELINLKSMNIEGIDLTPPTPVRSLNGVESEKVG
ncbi:MAG: RHS repeat-associated core domain-containing protein, partial [Anaerolineales bacterium]